ncbi:pentapeptide repeat-containing protein [Rufibacter sp. DG15C]|uniref:pentapeptide repeat-containing protein n=1 Tax=Rufibacter sp. DG15C TaxID=1379909 RepID=UPI00082F1A0B|nr:pentapeptide repeat-containing protein [Rufibacter sp. DG15C]
MKNLFFFLLAFIAVPVSLWAQTTVPASEVIAKINRGERVNYKNVTITGLLDLTQLQNKTQVTNINKGNDAITPQREYLSKVTAPLTFENCTFQGDVLAYYNPDNIEGENIKLEKRDLKNEIYNTDFEEAVTFANCVFEGKTAFKYSKFKDAVSFAGSTFKKEALFKYMKVQESVDFSKAKFLGDATFKYVKFPEAAAFNGATFADLANFKYAEFNDGADFQKARFTGFADFKYSQLKGNVKFAGATRTGDLDVKYAKVNNSKPSTSMIEVAK